MNPKNLTLHFTLNEMTRSAALDRYNAEHGRNIKNEPGAKETAMLINLCEKLLEPLRELNGGKPMIINSGYRSPLVNKLVGGVSTSYHLKGCAADIRCKNSDEATKLQNLLWSSTLQFTENIIETTATHSAYWLHVSYDPERLIRKRGFMWKI